MNIHANSKASFGGGSHIHNSADGSHTHNIPGYSNRQLDHDADLIIFCMRDRIHIGKNRYDMVTGNVSLNLFMDLVLKYYSKYLYNDIAVIFQEGLLIDMKKAISKVLDEYNVKEKTNDTFFRTRSGDGT